MREPIEMLVNHTNAQPDGIIRMIDMGQFFLNVYFPGVRLDQTVKDIHQCGFASAIFSHQSVDLTLCH